MKKEILRLVWDHDPAYDKTKELNKGSYRHFTHLPLSKLEGIAQHLDCTLDELLAAGLALLLYNYFGNNKIIITANINNIRKKIIEYNFHQNINFSELLKKSKILKKNNSAQNHITFEIKIIKNKTLLSLYYTTDLNLENIKLTFAKDYIKLFRLLQKRFGISNMSSRSRILTLSRRKMYT